MAFPYLQRVWFTYSDKGSIQKQWVMVNYVSNIYRNIFCIDYDQNVLELRPKPTWKWDEINSFHFTTISFLN